MDDFEYFDPIRVHSSFSRQQFLKEIGARLVSVEPGRVEIGISHHKALTQQHGFLHAGVVTTVIDVACGFSALAVMPPEAAVLSVEFKVNLLRPANAQEYRAVGTVEKAGRTLVVCRGELEAIGEDQTKTVALMQATMAVVVGKGLKD